MSGLWLSDEQLTALADLYAIWGDAVESTVPLAGDWERGRLLGVSDALRVVLERPLPAGVRDWVEEHRSKDGVS